MQQNIPQKLLTKYPSKLNLILYQQGLPGIKGLDKSSSPNTQPHAHISMAQVCFLDPSNNSGLRYHSVTTTGVIFASLSPYVLANPKSATVDMKYIFLEYTPVITG